jgi:hypothetical protein
VPLARVELALPRLEGVCSVQLSYRGFVGRRGLEPRVVRLKVESYANLASGPSGAYPDGLFDLHRLPPRRPGGT